MWELRRSLSPEKFKDLNRRITYATGADRGGWHLTKVLRLPGTFNFKYERPQKVRLLWDNGKQYNLKEIQDFVAGVESHEIDPDVKGLIIPAESRESILRGIWSRLDHRTRTLLSAEDTRLAADSPEGRSGVLWELECRLLESGLDPNEVFVVVRSTPWNKFTERGRADDYLWREIRKAHLHVGQRLAEQQGDETSGLLRLRPRLISYTDILTSGISEPGWLVEDWWTLGSHGIIAGLPKSYKSLISMDLAISTASESPFLGHFEVNPKAVGPVLIVQRENSMSLIKDRLWKITKSRGLHHGSVTTGKTEVVVEFPPALPIYFYTDFGFDMSNPDDREAIEEVIRQEGIVMVQFDPLYLMIGGADENNAKEMRPILSWLLRIRNLYNCAVLVIHHWGKGNIDRKGRGVGGIKLLGSTTIYGWLEAALYLEAKPKEDKTIEVVVEREFRERLSPPPVSFDLTMGDIGSAEYYWTSAKPAGSHNRLIYVLTESSGPLNYRRLQTGTGWSMKKLRSELAPLIEDGTIIIEQEGKRKLFHLA